MGFRKLPPLEIHYQDQHSDFILRPFEASDAENLNEAINESRGNLKKYMQWAHFPNDLESQTLRLQSLKADYLLGLEYCFGAFDKKTHQFLFSCHLFPGYRLNPSSMEMGYWVREAVQNRGLASLGVQIISKVAFDYFLLDLIFLVCHKNNFQSQRVAEKCGFSSVGLIPNLLPHASAKLVEDGFDPERSAYLYQLTPAHLKLSHSIEIVDPFKQKIIL